MKPYISIIIPSFNRIELLKETINSIKSQNFKDWECLIIDDGSTGENLKIISGLIQNDFRFRLIQRKLELRKGPSSCRNIGIRNAHGKFMMFLDSDDILSNDCLEYRVEKISTVKDFDFWIFNTYSFEENIHTATLFNNIPPKNVDESLFYKRQFLNGKTPFTVISVLWRSEILRKLGGFDSFFSRYEDPELHTRAFLRGYKACCDKSKMKDTFYRIRKCSKVSDSFKLQTLESRYKFAMRFAQSIKKERTWYFQNTLRSFAYPYDSKRYILHFLYLGFKTRNLSIQFILKALLLFQYHLFCLNKTRGFGYHRIRKWTFL